MIRTARRSWTGLAALMGLAGLALVAGSSTDASARSAAASACKPGQVEFRFRGKTTCRPAAQALPRPRKGDERLAILQALVAGDPAGPPDLQGRRPPSLADLLADFGPAAVAAVREGVAGLPGQLDKLKRASQRSLSSSATFSVTSACAPPQGVAKSDTYKKDIGNGSSFDMHVSLEAGKATAGFGIEGKAKDGSDRRVRWDYDTDLCDENRAFSVPECPTAEGRIDGSGKTRFTLRVSSIKDGKVEHSAIVEVKHDVKTKGTVAIDAKLDRVEIDDTYTTTTRSSGESIFWGPSSESGTVKRAAFVNMRTGQYDLGKANVVDVKVSYTGILSIFTQDALAQARVAQELAKKSDETFARTVKSAIDEYRDREKAWQTPNKCAELNFSPASRTLRLRDGQTGSFTGKTLAKRGGVTEGRWRRVAQRNGSFSPAQVQAKEPSFSYRVTNADREVSARYRVTSRAGVAQDTWVQGGTDLPQRFTGDFSGETRVAATTTFSGSITFVKNATSPAGTATYRVERVSFKTTIRGETPCRMNATATVSIARPDPRGSTLVISKQKTGGGYAYGIVGQFQGTQRMISVNCNGADFENPWVPFAALHSGPPGSALSGQGLFTDGRTIRGTYDSQPTSANYSWNLKGSG